MGARQFISVQFTDQFWDQVLPEGWRVFVLFDCDGEEVWTQTNTFHATPILANMEVLDILADGIKDLTCGVQHKILKIVVWRYPLDKTEDDVVESST